MQIFPTLKQFIGSSAGGNELLLAQQITVGGVTYPHKIDMYTPSGPIKMVLVLFPGAGSTSWRHAALMKITNGSGGMPTMANTSWGALQYLQCAVWVIQNFACDGVFDPDYNPRSVRAITSDGRLVGSWNNGIMYSGHTAAGDTAMCAALPTAVAAKYDSVIVGHVGHSNGAMFGQDRYYHHATNTYDFYSFASGPPALALSTATITNTVWKPTIAFQSAMDDVIGVVQSGGVDVPVYTQPIDKFSVADVKWPTSIAPPGDQNVGETQWWGVKQAFQDRVNRRNASKGLNPESMGAGVTTPAKIGTKTIYTCSASANNPQGANQLYVCSAGNHGVDDLQAALGQPLLYLIAAFGYANAQG
jgi:hypothetical protein